MVINRTKLDGCTSSSFRGVKTDTQTELRFIQYILFNISGQYLLFLAKKFLHAGGYKNKSSFDSLWLAYLALFHHNVFYFTTIVGHLFLIFNLYVYIAKQRHGLGIS